MGMFRKRKNKEQAESADLQRITPEKRRREGGAVKRLYRDAPWIFWGVTVSIALAVLFGSLYGIFRTEAKKFIENPIENGPNINWLYQNCYLLYRDLYNAQSDTPLDYEELYLEVGERHRWLLDSTGDEVEEMLRRDDIPELSIGTDSGLASDGMAQTDGTSAEGAPGTGQLTEEQYYSVINGIVAFKDSFQNLENDFAALNSNYDYIITDLKTGREITNMSTEDKNRGMGDYQFYLSFVFDETGNVSVEDELRGEDKARVRKLANEALRENHWMDYLGDSMDDYLQLGRVKTPVNCRVTFGVSRAVWNKNMENYYALRSDRRDLYSYYYHGYNYAYSNDVRNAYRNVGMGGILFLCCALAGLAGFFLPVLGDTKPWREVKLCSLPFEALFAVGIGLCALSEGVFDFAVEAASGGLEDGIASLNPYAFADLAWFLAGMTDLIVLGAFFFVCWYLGVGARALRDFGIRQYIRRRCLIYRFFPYMKGRAVGFYRSVVHMDLTRDAHKTIVKLLIVNAVVLAGISLLWVGGIPMIIVYSLLLYLLLRKYVSDLQEKYRMLLKATNQIADGNLNASVEGDWGIFDPFKPQVLKIEEGFQKAVDEEVKSQRMKTDLITNVSHDLKTPLTAIITYINLLKEDNVTQEQRREYLDTLERKSLRLKVLIEDLFEISKASSNNITLNFMDVDIMNLLKQVEFEMSDKLNAAGLDVRMNLTDEKVILSLDSQKTYRIYENLFGNIAKYAMPGTRVYVNGFRIDDTVVITLKNISAQEITVDSAELTERFVRGDASRNTEGSGLGLAIAKSFTTLQNGELSVEVDGDLFKVTTAWHVKD